MAGISYKTDVLEAIRARPFPCAQCGRPTDPARVATRNKESNGIFCRQSCARKFDRACSRRGLTIAQTQDLKRFYLSDVAGVSVKNCSGSSWPVRRRIGGAMSPQTINWSIDTPPHGMPKKWLDFHYGSGDYAVYSDRPPEHVFTHPLFTFLNTWTPPDYSDFYKQNGDPNREESPQGDREGSLNFS